MHLNECLQLAFSQPIESNNAAAVTDIISSDQQSVTSPLLTNDNNNNNSSSLEDTQQYAGDSNNDNFDIQRKGKGGSIYAMLQCILSEWGSKSQTNFHIPDDHYDGYSYLFEDNGGGGYDNRIATQAIHQNPHHYHHQHSGSGSSVHHHHHQPAYKVYAKDPNNLHSHHYDVYMHGNLTQTTMHTTSPINLLLSHPNHQTNSNNVITTSTHSISSNNHLLLHHHHHHQHSQTTPHPMMMTIPYLHPTLEIPVPPLQLPYYFGVLCWSYAIAGMLILYMPPKWCSCGGGRRRVVVVGRRKEEDSMEKKEDECRRRHWFPLYLYGWGLILCQSPCSFLADYVHMTNISIWHTIDRFLACCMMCLELSKLLTMRRFTRPYIYMLYLVFVAMAVFSFLKSQKSQQTLNEDGFIFWHCAWHFYPIACCPLHLVEHYMNNQWGEYYSFEEDEGEQMDSARITDGENDGDKIPDMLAKQPVVVRRSTRIAAQVTSM